MENFYFDDDDIEQLPEAVEKALDYLNSFLNRNNTIGTNGYEKKKVIEQLLRLHDEGIYLPVEAMGIWAENNHWKDKNVQHLMRYAEQINNDVRPRTSGV